VELIGPLLAKTPKVRNTFCKACKQKSIGQPLRRPSPITAITPEPWRWRAKRWRGRSGFPYPCLPPGLALPVP
jgi:hypothetical protein